MGSGQPNVCMTSDFHAVLFWFVYDTSAVRRPTLTIGSLWKGKLLDFRLVETFFENIKAFRNYNRFNTTT
jgi:hypothetical protein